MARKITLTPAQRDRAAGSAFRRGRQLFDAGRFLGAARALEAGCRMAGAAPACVRELIEESRRRARVEPYRGAN